MKELKHLSKNQLIMHSIFWGLIILFFTLVDPIPGNWKAKLFGTVLIYSNYIFAYYFIRLYLLPTFFLNKKIYLIIGIAASFVMYVCIFYIISFHLLRYLGGYSNFEHNPFFIFISFSSTYYVIIGASAMAAFFGQYNLYKIKLQSEKEKLLLQKELHFFKNQFTLNYIDDFLNYCYKEVQEHSKENAETILLFKDILKYTHQPDSGEKVALADEITYIRNFINLQKLLSSKVYVNFNQVGEFYNKYIYSRILIAFVENAFKHGVYHDPLNPIEINLYISTDKLTFTVKNKINHKKLITSTHIGMGNVKHLLEINYKRNYCITTKKEVDFYLFELILNLGNN